MSSTEISNTSSSGIVNKVDTITNKEKASIDDSLSKLLAYLPDSPYILTVPSYDLELNPWTLENEAALCRRTYPFRTAELHKQYMSFLMRDPADSCFEIRTEVDEERERRAKEQPAVPSPLLNSIKSKKKISLADYNKNKLAGGEKSQVSSPQSIKQGQTPIKQEESLLKLLNNDNHLKSDPHSWTKMPESIKDKKRKSPVPETTLDSSVKRQKTNNSSQHLPPLLSPLPSNHVAPLPPLLSPLHDKSQPTSKNKSHLPPMLSPLHPVGLELPPLLSPTLSPSLEEQLRRLENDRQKSEIGSTPPSTKKSSLQGSPQPISKIKSKEDLQKPLETDKKKSRLIVRLRYSKRIRKEILRILSSSSKETVSKSISQKETLKKRPPEMDLDTPNKKVNTSSNIKQSNSPISNPTTPSAPPPPHAHKLVQPITPTQNGSSAMARSTSNNSLISSTPRHVTPLPPLKGGDKARKSSPLPPAKAKEAHELSKWSKKFNDIGRQFKHEAQAIQGSISASKPIPDSFRPTKDDIIKAIRNIDCIMSYILAYSFHDTRLRLIGRPSEFENSWATLSGMIDVARNSSRFDSTLEALCGYLAYLVDKRVLVGIDSELLRSGVEATELDKIIRRRAALLDKAQRRFSQADDLLSLTILVKEFPETFKSVSGGRIATLEPEDLLSTHGINGIPGLPLLEFCTPPQAVRFGIALIKEWISKKGLDVELKICNVSKE